MLNKEIIYFTESKIIIHLDPNFPSYDKSYFQSLNIFKLTY